ncbi:unnamed protein product, partial [Mesorhabditis spiculigera]
MLRQLLLLSCTLLAIAHALSCMKGWDGGKKVDCAPDAKACGTLAQTADKVYRNCYKECAPADYSSETIEEKQFGGKLTCCTSDYCNTNASPATMPVMLAVASLLLAALIFRE